MHLLPLYVMNLALRRIHLMEHWMVQITLLKRQKRHQMATKDPKQHALLVNLKLTESAVGGGWQQRTLVSVTSHF